MLTRQRGQIRSPHHEGHTFEHHKSTKTLRQSVAMRCTICTGAAQTLGEEIDLSRDQTVALQAYLTKGERARNEFKGDGFKLDIMWGKAIIGHFGLLKTGMNILPNCLMLY